MTMYIVQASVVEEGPTGGRITHQIPTFFLDGDIQGIVSVKHAEKIVREIVNPLDVAVEVYPNVSEDESFEDDEDEEPDDDEEDEE